MLQDPKSKILYQVIILSTLYALHWFLLNFFLHGSLKFIGIVALDPIIIIIISSRKLKSMKNLAREKRINFGLAKNIVFMTHK